MNKFSIIYIIELDYSKPPYYQLGQFGCGDLTVSTYKETQKNILEFNML